MNRNQAFGMNSSLSSNIFNGTGQSQHSSYSTQHYYITTMIIIIHSCHGTDGFSLTDLHVSSDGSENVTGLDLSDFPALADRSRREGTGNPTPVLNPLAGRAPYGGPLVSLISLYQSKVPFKAKLEYQLIISSFSTLEEKLKHQFWLTAFL